MRCNRYVIISLSEVSSICYQSCNHFVTTHSLRPQPGDCDLIAKGVVLRKEGSSDMRSGRCPYWLLHKKTLLMHYYQQLSKLNHCCHQNSSFELKLKIIITILYHFSESRCLQPPTFNIKKVSAATFLKQKIQFQKRCLPPPF